MWKRREKQRAEKVEVLTRSAERPWDPLASPTAPTGKMAKYVPTVRMFWDSTPSTGWFSRHPDLPKK
jgi:hypothetical protein